MRLDDWKRAEANKQKKKNRIRSKNQQYMTKVESEENLLKPVTEIVVVKNVTLELKNSCAAILERKKIRKLKTVTSQVCHVVDGGW